MTDSRWRKCLTISSSSFPTCLPSLDSTSNAAPFHPPKVSTISGKNTMPSASHLASYGLVNLTSYLVLQYMRSSH